jgi:thiamine-phosphate pyrophosphorylase
MMQGLYAITPSGLEENDLLSKTEVLLKEGIKLIQYRDKFLDKKTFQEKARLLLNLTKKYRAKLLINDHIEICLEINADGFHLGLEDYSSEGNAELLKKNKEFITKNLICGLSCKWNKELVVNPPENEIKWTYLAVGSFYPSNTKSTIPETNENVKKKFLSYTDKPLVAIGGINKENIKEVSSLGYSCFALSEALFKNPKHVLNEYKGL